MEAPPAAKRRLSKGRCVATKTGSAAPAESPPLAITAGEDIEERPKDEAEGLRSTLDKIVEQNKCPLTQQLLVDPVTAEDGHIYERRALEQWLLNKKTSPLTNKEMGKTLMPALHAQQTVSHLIEDGVLDAESSRQFFQDRAELRASKALGTGPDLIGARSDFARALKLATNAAQEEAIEFQLKLVSWMLEGVNLFATAHKRQAKVGDTSGIEISKFALDLGESVRTAVTWPLIQDLRLTEWQDLPKGTRVKIMDDPVELNRLCERAPAGADTKVGWNSEMLAFTGKICTVLKVGDASHKNYVLRREAAPGGREFSFPYDTVFVLQSFGGR